MKQHDRMMSMLSAPKRAWDVLLRGRYDLVYDLMPLRIQQMSFAKRINLFKAGSNLVYRRLMPWNWPIHMQIELTSYCNLRCPICPLGAGKLNRPPMAMEPKLFENLMNEAGPYLLTISLWAWGEPLLHPQLADILRIAQKYPVATLLCTNGQNLDNPEVIEALATYPPTYLIIAMDGLTDATNSQFRVGAKLQPVFDGMRRLAEIKRQKDQTLPVLHMRYIAMKHNEHEIPLLEDFAREHHFELLTIRTLCTGDVPEQDYTSFIPDADELKAYRYQDGRRIQRRDFICTEPFWFPTVFADGRVVLCCHDYNADHSVGALSENVSFRDIWFGKQAAVVRCDIRDNRESINFCRHCPFADRQANDTSVRSAVINDRYRNPLPVPGDWNTLGNAFCTGDSSSATTVDSSISGGKDY